MINGMIAGVMYVWVVAYSIHKFNWDFDAWWGPPMFLSMFVGLILVIGLGVNAGDWIKQWRDRERD